MSVQTENLRFILGLKLRTLRHERGDSLRAVAERSGLSVSYLSEIEKGKKYPKPDKLIDLARALDVAYDDLVSSSVRDTLGPLKAVFSSDFIREFPFELFGLEPNDVFALVSDQPTRSAALIRTFLEVGRTYDMQVEHFLFAALRSYQQMHNNYFPDLEDRATAYRARQDWTQGHAPSAAALRERLTTDYGYAVDRETLAGHPELGDFRSVFVAGDPPTLLVNSALLPKQRAFVYAREIGYCEMDISARAKTSSWLRVESFDQLLNNFRASYFAGALLIDRAALLDDLDELFARSSWAPDALRASLERYNATPEMMAYRLTQLVPHHFGLDDFFFLRFYHEPGTPDFRLTKILNLSDVPVPHGIGLKEHYCHRWPAIKLLKEMAAHDAGAAGSTGDGATAQWDLPLIRAQRSRFIDAEAEYFVVSMARPLALQARTNSCVSVGFLMDDAFRERTRCWQDSSVPSVDVNLTCERCALRPDECAVRAAPPTMWAQDDAQARKEEALEELRAAVRAE